MKKYKVSLWLNSRNIQTMITADSYASAQAMIKAQYPAATSISINEVR